MKTLIIGDIHGDHECLTNVLKANDGIYDIVQVGDLGNFVRGSEADDRRCYEIARNNQFTVLWGNHDAHHVTSFAGLVPHFDPRDYVKPKFYADVQGWIVTHAGIAPTFVERFREYQANPTGLNLDDKLLTAISYERGWIDPVGGILWRDDSEPLAREIKQIYGHTPQPGIVEHTTDGVPYGYCIDTHPRPGTVGPLPYMIVKDGVVSYES